MPLFSCLLRKAASADTEQAYGQYKAVDTISKGASVTPTVNAQFIDLLHSLASLEGGGLPVISDACRAVCEHLESKQACVCLLGADQSATVVACAGIDGSLALGRRMMTDLLDMGCHSSSVVGAALHTYENSPSMPVVFREAPPSALLASKTTIRGQDYSNRPNMTPRKCSTGGGTHRSPLGGVPPGLPEEWQQLAEDHKLTQFAAAVIVAAGVPVGILTLAAKGPARPSCWTAEVIQAVAGLLAGHIRHQGLQLADSLSQLHSACTISELVEAVSEAAVEVAAAVAHMRGQARVAFLSAEASSAAIFQQQQQPQQASDSAATTGMPSPLLARNRRTSCEYVMRAPPPKTGSRKSLKSRISMDAAAFGSVGRVASVANEVNIRPKSVGDMNAFTGRRGRSRMSFTMPSSGKGPSCKGHTLPLSGTLLAEALSKEAAGLCISDCASYVQDKKAFPRDTVLSRDGVMPFALALATVNHDGKPLLALYLTYSCTLPQPLLQAVVQELQQLLQAILPIIKSKLDTELRGEWGYLRSQLEEALRGKGPADGGTALQLSAVVSNSDSDQQVSFASLAAAGTGAAAEGGNGNGPENANGPRVDRAASGSPSDASISFNDAIGTAAGRKQSNGGAGGGGMAASHAAGARSETSGNSPFTTGGVGPGGAACSGGGGGGGASGVRRRLSLLGPARSEGPNNRPNSGLRKLLGMSPSEGHDGGGSHLRPQSGTGTAVDSTSGLGIPSGVANDGCGGGGGGAEADSGESNGSARGTAQAPNKRLMQAIQGVSFKLEAARSPRGASRLAPIITIMHERLKAAQAAQMTGSRTEARKADLQSVKLLQEIGKGGYGTVYRGTYHGAEVAVKVIQEKELAALQTISGDVHSARPSSVLLHKQNIHDAIELVASVSVSHPNIVQVLTFFTDCKLQLPESINTMFDSMDMDMAGGAPGGGPARLVHLPSLLESPAPGQDVGGGISVALVMEYMDAGCLADAIQNRVFFERLEPQPTANGRPGKSLLAVSMRSVYATLLEIALALRHMHSLHLVHCDLKPQNVLLKTAPRDPRGFTAKLSDFGLAKTMAHDENGQLVIDEAVGSGTITHIAPEVFMGKKSLGAAVDIYAFGILMFQVLCGMRLYEGMTVQDIANSVAHRMMRPALPAWVPANYRALAERCWHQVPSVRPTADDLVRQLEKLSDFKRSRQQQRPQSGQQH